MKKPKPIPKSDWGYVPVDPDPDFDPERNQRIIDETIKESRARRRKLQAEYDEKLRERTSAVAQYLKGIEKGKTSNVEKYFGRSYLAKLRGQEILETVRNAKKKEKGQT